MVGEKILPCNLGLKSKAEKSAVPMGLKVDAVWIIARVLMKGCEINLAL